MIVNREVEEALNIGYEGVSKATAKRPVPMKERIDVMEEYMDFDLPDMNVEVSQEGPRVVEDEKKVAVKMAFLGLGQGGGNMADTFWSSGYRRVVLVNTTEQDFKGVECPNTLVIGDDTRGAGKDPKLGAKVFEFHKEEVLSKMKSSFGKEVELVMICVGAGGGTGGGSARGAIKLAKEFVKNNGAKNAKIGVMVSMPSQSEGSAVSRNAEELIEELMLMAHKKEITPLVVADNGKILKIFPSTKVGQRWRVINRSVCGLFDSFNVLAAQSSGYATFDPEDYKRVLFSGVLVFGRSVLEVPETGTELSDGIRKNLKGGFLSDRFNVKTATHAASVIVANESVLNELPQDAYDTGFDTLQRVIGSDDVIMYQGIFDNNKVKGIHLFTIVGGLETME